MPLGKQQPGQPVLEGRRRYQAAHQRGRALVQGTLRRAVRGPLDPAIRRVGGPRVDPRQLQRARIGPGAVSVAVGQVGGAPAGQLVEQLAAGRPAVEPFHPPAAAGYPLDGGVARGIGADPVQRRRQRRGADQVAADHGHACECWVDMGILEARQ